MTRARQPWFLPRLRHAGTNGNTIPLFLGLMLISFAWAAWSQSVPAAPNAPWHSPQEKSIEQDAKRVLSKEFTVDTARTYTLGDLIDLAEAHNPETRLAWEQALSRADAYGVARSELYPTLAALALSQTAREQIYLNTRYYRQTLQPFDLALELNYPIFDFGARGGRIDAARAQLLVSDFAFNDVHRQLIY